METKKLTCSDLTIEDYVYSTFSDKACKVQAIELSEHGYGSVRVTGVDGVKDIISVSPIPLTAEILEKNGFYFGYTSQQEDAASQIGCSCEKAWTYDEGGGSIQVTFPNECDGGLIVLDDQDFDKELEYVFANQIYVHELQHLIRICKINKEIVL